MKYLIFLLALLFSTVASAIKDINTDFISFCYHDVHNKVIGKLYKDSGALHTNYLINHFRWLKQNGYTSITTKMIQQAQNGEIELPEKSVLLTFDDGYKSFYTTIYPLLKQFNFHATYAIVSNWIGNPDEKIKYGKETKYKSDFLTWQQVKEMADSGLIEIASHTHNSHQGILANPQGNEQPAMTSRLYQNGEYETDQAYKNRIYKDLKLSRDLISENTGKIPTTLVWPYGSYSEEAWDIAKSLGFKYSLTLDEGLNSITSKTEHISRFLIDSNPSLVEFKSFFKHSTFTMPQRVVHVDLDYIYDPDEKQLNKNLGMLLERIKRKNISTVYLQAFADSDGDGNADALYFKNDYLPVKSDIFNRVAWQLRTRSGVKVYAWMPITSFIIEDDLQKELAVLSWNNGTIGLSNNNYKRLSFFKPKTKEIILSIYSSLAKYSKFAGILYHDDGLLTDFEDLTNEALEYYKSKGLIFNSVSDLVTNKSISYQWAHIKANALIDFTNEITKTIRHFQPTIKTARNIYAQAILKPISEHWIAQNFNDFVTNYDTTAIMAMPYMEGASNGELWMAEIADKVINSQLPKNKIVFEIQAKDWRTGTPVTTEDMKKQFWILAQHGIANYGYYPDDLFNNHPDIDEVFPDLSLATFPFYKR